MDPKKLERMRDVLKEELSKLKKTEAGKKNKRDALFGFGAIPKVPHVKTWKGM